MGKFFKWLFLGALIGVGLGLALYALGFVVEIFNCTFACGDPTRKDAIPAMWEKGAFGNVIMYCSIGCCVIGSIYGVASGIQEHNKTKEADRLAREKSALRQRKKNATELKSDLETKLQSAHTVQNNADNYDFSSEYSSDSLQQEGWMALNEVENINEDLKAIIEEAKNEKEGL